MHAEQSSRGAMWPSTAPRLGRSSPGATLAQDNAAGYARSETARASGALARPAHGAPSASRAAGAYAALAESIGDAVSAAEARSFEAPSGAVININVNCGDFNRGCGDFNQGCGAFNRGCGALEARPVAFVPTLPGLWPLPPLSLTGACGGLLPVALACPSGPVLLPW